MLPDRWLPSNVDLSRRNRLIVYYLVGIAILITLYAILYNVGMATFEGEDQSIVHSFGIVVETMTTTGYGADSPWGSTAMNAFVIFMQLSGIGLGFFTLRVIVIPLFTGAEVDLDARLSPKRDHVVICGYRRDSAVLLDELEELGLDYVLISSGEERAKDLSDDGYAAIHGSPHDPETLRRASIDAARAVLVDDGEGNVNAILTVRSLRDDVEVIALTDDSGMADVLENAGADTVLSPHGVLGHRLAEKAVAAYRGDVTDTIDLGADIEVTEIPVHQGSELTGLRIRDSNVRERTGANVIGAWIDGELQLPPDPDAVISQNTVLLVTGGHGALTELSEFTRPAHTFEEHERIVVAGAGEVGQAARSVIEDAGIEVVSIDVADRPDVDVVGDAGSAETLERAEIEDAGALIVGVPDDSTALLATVLARSIAPEIEILVRVHDTDATRKALSGGADYVLSVPRVSARMVARELRGEAVLSPASQIRLVRAPARPFAGDTIAESGIFEKTGCRVIAIEDESGIDDTVNPHRRLTGDEQLTLVGTDEALRAFRKRFDVSPTEPSA
ncbi:MAG: NAD-binding protein [Halobacteriales archaeon]